jgi:hypothetical protein
MYYLVRCESGVGVMGIIVKGFLKMCPHADRSLKIKGTNIMIGVTNN